MKSCSCLISCSYIVAVLPPFPVMNWESWQVWRNHECLNHSLMQTGVEWRLARLLRLHKWVLVGASLLRPAASTGVPCSLPCSTRSSLISFLTFYDVLWHPMTLHYPAKSIASYNSSNENAPVKMLPNCLDQILSHFILSFHTFSSERFHLRKHLRHWTASVPAIRWARARFAQSFCDCPLADFTASRDWESQPKSTWNVKKLNLCHRLSWIC